MTKESRFQIKVISAKARHSRESGNPVREEWTVHEKRPYGSGVSTKAT